MNVDTARLDLREYAALLHGWNAGAETDGKPPRSQDFTELQRFMEAHSTLQ